MLKIGDFSKLANVTIKTLRYYDQFDLLKPVYTDRYNGYRYYSLEQLPRLNRILALKDLGFSLEQISLLMKEDLPVERLQLMLHQHQNQLEEHLREEQQRLQRVSARLAQIAQEGFPPHHEILLKHVPNQWIASRGMLPAVDIPIYSRIQETYQQLKDWTLNKNLIPMGPWMILQRTAPEKDAHTPFELAQAVTSPVKNSLYAFRENNTDLRVLIGSDNMASVVHTGSRATLHTAYQSLYTWSEHNGFVVNGHSREIYLPSLSEDYQDEDVFEIQVPLESIKDRERKYFAAPQRKTNPKEPQILSRPAFMAVGLSYHGANENGEIGLLWGDFMSRITEVEHTAGKMETFGLCYSADENGNFEYVACIEVNQVNQVPQDMVIRFVPECTYAVFTHIGLVTTLGETYDYILNTWFPQSDYVIGDGPDFELYTEEFFPDNEKARMYIYFPVKPK